METETNKTEQVANQQDEVALMNIKKPVSRKEKEKKIMDFKFRITDLLEIYLVQSKNPIHFFTSLVPVLEHIKENLNDKTKVSYAERLSQLIKKFFDKTPNIIDNEAEFDECFKKTLYYAAKFQKVFEQLLLQMIKLKVSSQKDCNEFLSTELNQALEKFGKKKEIFYTESFFKQIIKIFPQIGINLLDQLLQFGTVKSAGGPSLDRTRKQIFQQILNILLYLFQNKSFSEQFPESLKRNFDKYSSFFESCFEKQNEIQWKKTTILLNWTQLLDIFSKYLSKYLEEEQNQKIKNLITKKVCMIY